MTDTNQHPNIERAAALRAIARVPIPHIPESTRDVLETVAYQLESDAKRYQQFEDLQRIGKNCAECLAEMVAALECDYERLVFLRELREQASERVPLDGDPTNYWIKIDADVFSADDAEELKELEEQAGECESREDAEQRIAEDPLSIEVGGTWSLGETPTADRAYILLGTGGPATRIVCELGVHQEPTRAWVQAQDWFTPWTDYTGDAISQDALLAYCGQFFFGE